MTMSGMKRRGYIVRPDGYPTLIKDREFLFTYCFAGADWGISIFAADPAEAREKIKAVALARYDGEVAMRIPAAIPAAGLITRLICWWRNKN